MNLIDTNVIIRYLVDDSGKYPGVSALFSRLKSGDEKIECTLIVFFQMIFVIKSFYKVSIEKIVFIMQNLITMPGFVIKEKRLLIVMLDLWKKYGEDIVDTYLTALAEAGAGRKIYSLDKGLDKLTSCRVEPR